MDWVLISIIYFFASVILYLLIRKAQKDNISIPTYSVFMFVIPLIGCFALAVAKGLSFSVSTINLLLIIVSAILFSYFGNYASQKGIINAQNPGYSLIIQKSYVLFTTIAAILLFGSELTIKSAIGIILIVGFSAIIIIQRKQSGKKKNTGSSWIKYSIAAFFCYGFLALASKYFIDQGINPIITLFYILLVVSILMLIDITKKKAREKINSKKLPILIGIGLFSLIFNLFAFFGYQAAPNPGYINAVNAASISLLTIFSVLLFKDEFSIKKLIGIIGVIAGMILLLI